MSSAPVAGPERGVGADGPAELVARAAGGDQRAFGELFAEFSPLVHGIALSRLPPREADDLVQDVFLVAWQNLAELREPAKLGAWLCAIARRRAIDWLRSHRPSDVLTEEMPAEADPDFLAAREVLSAIKELSEAYREPLILRLVEGMSGPEIADKTGLTPASVRVNLHRGMKQLRAKLGLGDDDE